MESTTLARRATVTELVRTYEQAVTEIRRAFAAIAAAEKRLNDAFTLEGHATIHIQSRHHYAMDYSDPTDTIEQLKRDVWHSLVERLELRKMLSVARAKQLDELLERGQLPEITEASVFAFADSYMRQLPDMLTEKVQEVFEFLRPRRSRYKRNSELEIPPRVILSRWADCQFPTHFCISSYHEPECTALESVFLALDGRGTMPRDYHSALSNAVRECTPDSPCGGTEYFAFRCCLNGNLHVTFKRPDLLKKLNEMAGGKRLRPGKAA